MLIQGAIIAQVGITALTLDGVDQAHWSATAFFVSSLVLGCLSVYVSFIVQQELNGLISGVDVADWLSRPLSRDDLYARAYALSHHPAFRAQGADMENIPNAAQLQNGAADLQLKREASVLTAIMLATPAGLLSLSLNSFIVGLGIYLGCVYADGLIAGFGKGGSLGILIFYLCAAVVGTFMSSFPRLMKSSELHDAEKTSGMRAQLEALDQRLRDYRTENLPNP
ncbi:hypothetical protein F5Y05DRAFT_290525 [Hypoxylon sp. FL0543]|nr:hypothetical protein F5Y05DRAFT_290525 [Hypoxylon sp. FL0543]